MEIALAALALLLVQLLPFTVLKRSIQRSGDLLHPLRLISVLGIVSTVPFLLATAMDPETISRPTRVHPDLPDLTGGVLWYCLLQGVGFLCLFAGYLAPKRFDRFRLGLRHLTVQEWRSLGVDLAPVRAALDAGVHLLAPQTSYLIASKKVLAWVSQGCDWMSAADRTNEREAR